MDLFDLAERLGVTVATLRRGRSVPLSALEFEQWRARERFQRTLAQQAANKATVAAPRNRRRGMGR